MKLPELNLKVQLLDFVYSDMKFKLIAPPSFSAALSSNKQ
jgi:hypothetical protein